MAAAAEPSSERPLRRDAERNRARILEAAREVFATRGLAATLDDVAHHAGVGVGTVYRRFPTKEALVSAALVGRLEEVVALAREALDAPTGWDGLATFLRRSTDMQAEDSGLRDVVLRSDWAQAELCSMRDAIAPLVRALLDRAHAEGSLRPDVTAEDLPAIFVMVSQVAEHARDFRPDLHRRYCELLLDALRARPGNSPLGEALSEAEAEQLTARWAPRRH
ncbi:AcrR family transcriptional regulator [Motilibacter peucedani]|uniref:AcrR family transcriptional regulator n=1 Tax=Motilibacter peucedani TaxID=598650 RepID=A0A420XQF9_9ACTN|nr:TetR/AcrR family transcriptional regulator [Motilibacter peucedani]RKS75477.1 AcrR family transcriptional regulator [Motilibacter peucedani]